MTDRWAELRPIVEEIRKRQRVVSKLYDELVATTEAGDSPTHADETWKKVATDLADRLRGINAVIDQNQYSPFPTHAVVGIRQRVWEALEMFTAWDSNGASTEEVMPNEPLPDAWDGGSPRDVTSAPEGQPEVSDLEGASGAAHTARAVPHWFTDVESVLHEAKCASCGESIRTSHVRYLDGAGRQIHLECDPPEGDEAPTSTQPVSIGAPFSPASAVDAGADPFDLCSVCGAIRSNHVGGWCTGKTTTFTLKVVGDVRAAWACTVCGEGPTSPFRLCDAHIEDLNRATRGDLESAPGASPGPDDAPGWMALSALIDSARDVCRDSGSTRELAINCLRYDLARFDAVHTPTAAHTEGHGA